MQTFDQALAERPLGLLQAQVATLCAIALVFDGYDIGAIGYAVPALAEAWNLPPATFTLPIVLGGVGMLVGSLISGLLADWYGRKPVFLACVAIFGLASVGSALAGDVTQLTIARLIAGIGLGGGVPTAIALTSDYLPAQNRAMLAGAMTGAVPIGLIAGGLASSKLIPLFGWPAIFMVGGIIPLLLLPLLAVLLPESVQMLRTLGRAPQQAAALIRRLGIAPESLTPAAAAPATNPVASLFAAGIMTRTVLLWVMFLGNFLATWLVIFWLPTIMSSAGATAGDAAFYGALLPTGGLAAVIFIAMIAGRLGIERVLTIALCVAAITIFMFWYATMSTAQTAVLIFIVGAGLQGAQFGMNGLSGAVYPPAIRSTGSGWAFGVGRIGNIVGPGLGGLVLSLGFQPKAMFLVALFAVIAAAIAMVLLGRERDAGRLAEASNLGSTRPIGHRKSAKAV